ncbi:hypothetical protein SRABI76_02415 [Microbacterium oxydans]|uniref:Uncharacterized protein n=1 Tax=Microbacterium oxydans TaxID=82380 RepID=A0A0F0LFL1_9MICO|nr:hypothetical protein [Microbacterium oxydans]KJL30311.1 hypothetical protein RS83_01061 [Microbacterium oxydans]CAH0217165.1 hypothetical protein SRABI76_02415 [Microbacterium oxydans]
MTDLNPTPNKKLIIAGIEGFGSVIAGAVAIVVGLLMNAVPLIWIGVGLIVAGGILALVTARRRRRDAPDSR